MNNVIKQHKALVDSLSLILKNSPNFYRGFNLVADELISAIKATQYYPAICNDPGKISYAKSEDVKFNEKKRTKTSFKRFVRCQLNLCGRGYRGIDLDRLYCEILSVASPNIADRIKILSGKDIVKFYASTFNKTCMTGRKHSPKIEFYANNPDVVKMIVVDNNLRAFLWKTDEGKLVLDRVYPKHHRDIPLLRKWAADQGYLIRSNADGVVDRTESVGISGGMVYHVTVNKSEYYPYLDTFRFGKIVDDKIILSNSADFGNIDFINCHGIYGESPTCAACEKVCRREKLFHFRINVGTGYYNERYETYDVCDSCYYENRIQTERVLIQKYRKRVGLTSEMVAGY